MKNIKKLFSTLLVLMVSLTGIMGLKAETGTITVNKTIVGQNYSIYRILDLESYDSGKGAYIYRANESWKGFVESATDYLVANSENGNTYYTWKTGASVVEFSEKAMAYAKTNNVKEVKTLTATTTTVKFTGLELGYYLVKSSVGSVLSLDTTNPDGTVNEKNTVTPDIKKEVKEDSTGIFGSTNDAQIGDKVEYKTTITTGANYIEYKVYDTMSEGLTFNNDIVVTVNGTTISADNYTVSTTETGYTFVVTFKDEFIKKQPLNTDIVVNYSATLNEKAVIEGSGNINKTRLEYKNETTPYKTPERKTITYSYAFNLVKTNKDSVQLEGAEFKLYDKKDKEVKVVVKNAKTNTYRVAVDGEVGVTIKAGSAIIEGLDNDTYKLEEVVAPKGYNPLTSKISFTVKAKRTDNTVARTEVKVINYTGTELPETGGFGTTLFITLGSIIVLSFGLLLVTKLRLSKENI